MTNKQQNAANNETLLLAPAGGSISSAHRNKQKYTQADRGWSKREAEVANESGQE